MSKSDDTIYRQAAIDALFKILDRPNHADFLYADEIHKALNELPPAQPDEKTSIPTAEQACDVCENLEKDDTLYSFSDWDGGIGFDYIHNIRFCPACGRRL